VHVVLGFEVLEEAALRQADGLGDVVQADRGQPANRGLAGRGVDDARPGGVALSQWVKPPCLTK
jgi:hypothetical protein